MKGAGWYKLKKPLSDWVFYSSTSSVQWNE
jgi:hypothetical protein